MATAKRLDAFIAPSKEAGDRKAPAHMLRSRDMTKHTTLAGDASAVGTCALEVAKKLNLFSQYILTPEEQKLSSGQRELITVLRALQGDREFFQSLANNMIIWLTDSTNLVSFLTKGTMQMHIQKQVLEVYRLLAQYHLRIVPVHLRSTDFRI